MTTGDAARFLAAAGSLLRAERARNTVLLTVAETARANPSHFAAPDGAAPSDAGPGGGCRDKRPLFGWWTPGDETVRGAFLHTPPFPVLLTAVPSGAAAELAAKTLADRPLAGVNGYYEAATAFAAAWADGTGGRVTVHRHMRLYRLSGRPRVPIMRPRCGRG